VFIYKNNKLLNLEPNLQRFIQAQQLAYATALKEIKNGRKTGHWMWYVFPQLAGLGHSEMSQYYSLSGITEAEAYFRHPVLGARLIEITTALLETRTSDVTQLMGSPDDLKLCSSMTVFSLVRNSDLIFQKVLDKFFGGKKDFITLSIIESHSTRAITYAL
jgi:uncharacterized protein (DUF1810 family)